VNLGPGQRLYPILDTSTHCASFRRQHVLRQIRSSVVKEPTTQILVCLLIVKTSSLAKSKSLSVITDGGNKAHSGGGHVMNIDHVAQKLDVIIELLRNQTGARSSQPSVTVTEALVLRPLLEDRGRITESVRILVPVDRMKKMFCTIL